MTKRFDLDVGKRRARKRLREFIKSARIFDKKRGQILCFPGEQGWEIEQVYRPLGFPDHNIWGIERDPKAARAIRERYPNINLYEGELMDFVLGYEGPPFIVVSLDYCGHLGQDKVAPLAMLEVKGLIAERAVVAMNVMAGREDSDDQDALRELHAKVKIQPLFEDGPVDVMDALAVVREANTDRLSDARDNALTQGITSTLGYLIPASRACFNFDLTKTTGHAIRLQKDTVALRDVDNGKLVLKNATVIEKGSDKIQVAQQIKHEAIIDINRELEERGIIQAAERDAHALKIHASFFKYHLGRTLVMAWFDRWSQPSIPVRLDRISYISDSGKRMLSDYVEVHAMTRELDQLKDAIQPFTAKHDPELHRFALHPDPDSFPSMLAYLTFLKKLVSDYARLVGKVAKTESAYWDKREDLGGGEAIPVDEEKLKKKVIELVQKGKTTEEIASKVKYLSIGTIKAIRAHCTMGSYGKGS